MSARNGDKSRFGRLRKAKLLRRVKRQHLYTTRRPAVANRATAAK